MKQALLLVLLLLVHLLISNKLDAQKSINFGLKQPQAPNTLPVSKAQLPMVNVQPNQRLEANPVRVQKRGKNKYALTSGWKLADADELIGSSGYLFSPSYNTAGWYNATVPGTVLTTLVRQGVYPNPYLSLNNLLIPDSLCRTDWWYRIQFKAPKGEKDRNAWLQLNGINYRADVWLNGKKLGEMHGAFVRGQFDISKVLKSSQENVLAVHIYPPPNPGIPHEESAIAGAGPNGGQLCMDGPTFISSEGWDWIPGIRDRNIGLWQGVNLDFTGPVSLQDPQVITKLALPDTTTASIIIKASVINHSVVAQNSIIHGKIGNIEFSRRVLLQAGESKIVRFTPETNPVLRFHNPALWWPNGYGKQNLYHLNLSVSDNSGKESDEKDIRFGIRELSYELLVAASGNRKLRISYNPVDFPEGKPLFDNINCVNFSGKICMPRLQKGFDMSRLKVLPDTANPFLVIKVNGRRIFCKGGNWGMDDGMKRVSRQDLEPAFRLEKEANCNMIRNWTGESTEEVFYELADEYGMLVWNDFWMSTKGYNLRPLDNDLMVENISDVVRRFRNHPSIAVWCASNEGVAPKDMENKIADQIAKDDGTRHYNGSSIFINMRKSGGWNYVENPADYFNKQNDGFTTEIGTFSIPEASTIRKFIQKPDLWPIDDVWNYHDLHTNRHLNLKGYLNAADSLYGKATSLDDFNRKIQLINYESHRAIFEAWNSKLWKNASGVLLWMTHPAWPSMIWQIYSYDFQTNGSYYGLKKACEPLHIQMNLDNNQVVAVNTSLHSYPDIWAVLKIYSLKGKIVYTRREKITLDADNKKDVFLPDFAGISLPDVYLARLSLEGKHHQILDQNSYWKTNGRTKNFQAFNQLSKAKLGLRVISQTSKGCIFEIRNRSGVSAIGVRFNLLDQHKNIHLPAYFSDGYFTLLPGETKRMSVQSDDNIRGMQIEPSGYNVKQSIFSVSNR